MNDKKTALDLLSEVNQADTIEESLARTLQITCQRCDAVAAGVAGVKTGRRNERSLFSYDPQGIFARGGISKSPCDKAHVMIPLLVDSLEIGQLNMWFGHDRGVEGVRKRVQPLDTLIALMLTGLRYRSCSNGLLDDWRFRERVETEKNRADRFGEGFSIVHLDLSLESISKADVIASGWNDAQRIGDSLLAKLRACDAVGLLGPEHLAVLLANCSPLCASIAERRITEVLGEMTGSAPGRNTFFTISYPQHTTDINELLGDAFETASLGKDGVGGIV